MSLARTPTVIVTLNLLSGLLVGPALALDLDLRQQEEQGDASLARPDTKPARSGNKLCFRAQGCPKCDWAILLGFSMASSPERCGQGPYASGELGLLRNVSTLVGIGGTFFYGGDDCGARYGFRSHVRIWLHPQIGLDFGPGIILGDDDEYSSYEWPGFTGQVSLNLAGLIAPFYQVDMLPGSYGTHWDSFAGVKMDSYGAPLSVVLLMVAVAATWDSY